jgi:hypothetical protein
MELLERLGSEPMAETAVEAQQDQRRRQIAAINRFATRTRERLEVGIPTAQRTVTSHPAQRRAVGGWQKHALAFGVAAAVTLGVAGWGTLQRQPIDAPVATVSPEAGRVVRTEGSARVIHPHGSATKLGVESTLQSGDLVMTEAAARIDLALATHVHVQVLPETRLQVGGSGAAGNSDVWMTRGIAHFEVQKRPTGTSFSVRTPDADVTVHGTSFSVEVREIRDGTRTSVSVEQGVVSIRAAGRTSWLNAGDSWSSGVEAPQHIEPADAAANQRVSSTQRTAATRPARAQFKPDTAQSNLAAETQAFSAAMSARRNGEDAHALKRLDEFLTAYPNSPLAPNARVERFRLLKRLGRVEEAASAARQYMAENPNGFARDEARGIAITPPMASAQ